MTYSTVMTHMDVGSENSGVLRVTTALAKRFGAGVIGIAACQPIQMVYGDGYVAGDMIQENLAEIALEMKEAEARFRSALTGKAAPLQWRSVNASVQLSDFVVREARAADLIITGPDLGWSAFDASRRVVISDVVLQAGRPVLIVPPGAEDLRLERVVIAWKDTREARRAIVDALPMLKMAGQVIVLEITVEDDTKDAPGRLDDITAWLHRHGVASTYDVVASIGDDAAQLNGLAEAQSADLMVAGAYGHGRLREWVLGGVTRNLLSHPSRCTLVSH
ncbi:universal stress protein [Lichenifustis flavocetrariae]|uniref:Universal stress protein n=1 Tax=Lichenifustis flavocetrariae TaxID=2949735 RepID=A0AA41YW03_9HYPH|nr:universal stress protein [Lichenifustis flavocetrariae]MCW6508246.1 universal stress protein [Lichenifustis flavocetrariae]